MQRKLEVLELFSGIRATSEALDRQGIPHNTFTVEYNPKVQEVANLLWGTNEPVRDITQFTPEKEYDLVVGGFPCQPFSMAGKGQGFHDEKGRGKLYQDTLRVIKAANPTYVILENVKAITFAKHKWIITEIEETLKEWGYFVQTQIINAKDYIPQNRERVFIMASKIRQPEPIKEQSHSLLLKDFLEKDVSEDLYYGAEKLESIHNWAAQERPLKKIAHAHTEYVKTITTRTQPGTSSQQMVADVEYSALERFLLENRVNIPGIFHNTFNAENYITGIGTEEERIREGGNHVIGTITASGANSRQKIFESLVPLRIRSLTPRESLRLMGWRDNQIDKVIHLSKSKLYFTAGNSMAIPVMEAIVKELIK